jgi:hypothetical protein
LEEISFGLAERFFFVTGGGALCVFIWAAIGLKYHPASRLRWWASNGRRGTLGLYVAAMVCATLR